MSDLRRLASFFTIFAKLFDCTTNQSNFMCQVTLRGNGVLYLDWLAFVFQKRITEFGISRSAILNLPKDGAGGHLESEINAQFFRQL